MNKTIFKKIIILSSICLIFGITSTFAQYYIELKILGGGYKLSGPSLISFQPVSSGMSGRTNTVSFAEASENNYLLIADENGGNPFDVTVTSSEIKRNETLETTTIEGSSENTLKVADTNGFTSGDTINISEYDNENDYHIIQSVNGNNNLILTENFTTSPPSSGYTVNRIVRCDISPQKCIPLTGFKIKNGESLETIYGKTEDFIKNIQTETFTSFRGKSTTIGDSHEKKLYVEDATQFNKEDIIKFPEDSDVMPKTNTVKEINGINLITLENPFTTPPNAGISVESLTTRSLSLGNGNGAAPGQWKIVPVLENNIPAGQIPGTYEGVLTFTII